MPEGKQEQKEKQEEEEKPEKYELILAEKPAAMMKIAYALADIAPVKRNIQGIPYYELLHENKNVVVACAVGHLFSLTSEEKGFPVFSVEWKPNYKVRKKDFTKKYYSAIYQLAKNASSFIIACDYDVEGELIGYNILRYICKQEDAERMKFSTLTKPDLQKAYQEKLKHIDFALAKSGETRHILDFFYGISLSRALMSALRKVGAFRILSIGRVQGPALAFVVAREKAIREFKPESYWRVFLLVSNAEQLEVKFPRNITKKEELEKFKELKGKQGEAKTEKKKVLLKPPVPFDLTTLQIEAYKFYGITPSRLLQISQQLYLAGIISYPRTASQKLPPSIGYKRIMEKLSLQYKELTKHASKEKPIEGKHEDAHPAIYPTGEKGKLDAEQHKIYELIVRRFISCFCADAEIEQKKIIVEIDKLKFFAQGITIKRKGWLDVYKTKLQERMLPDLQGNVIVEKINIAEKQTTPPKRYTPASIISELAKRNLGTKATRASIIDTLFQRGYIEGKQIGATQLGITLVDTLKKYVAIILDEKLTRHFEEEMQNLQETKKTKLEKKEKSIVEKAKKIIEKISKEWKVKEEKIGSELKKAHYHLREKEREEAKIMPCPKCGEGFLVLRKGKYGQFIACDAYPKCKTTFNLPKNCLIKKANEKCECGFPLLLAIRKGKRPWKFCFNPECSKKQE